MLHLKFTILIETFWIFLIIYIRLYPCRWSTKLTSSIILISLLGCRYSKLHLIWLNYRIFVTVVAKISFQISCPESPTALICILFFLIKRELSCSVWISGRILCSRRIILSMSTLIYCCTHSISAYLPPGKIRWFFLRFIIACLSLKILRMTKTTILLLNSKSIIYFYILSINYWILIKRSVVAMCIHDRIIFGIKSLECQTLRIINATANVWLECFSVIWISRRTICGNYILVSILI